MLRSDTAKGKIIASTPDDAGELIAQRAEITLTAAQVTDGQIIEMAALPGDCDLIDARLDTDQLDSNGAPTLTADIGIMSGTYGVDDATRTCGNELFNGDTTVQGGGVASPSQVGAFRIARTDSARGIGIKLATAAATAVGGTVGLTLYYRG